MSTALLEAAKTLVEAEKESRRASLAVREAHRSCATHSYGYCQDSVCIVAENAHLSAVRAELEAQKAGLVELRKLAEANAPEPHCFECGASESQSILTIANDGNHQCADESACADRCRETRER